MTDITSEPSLKTKKRILPRMSILIPAVLVLALAYLFYFQPSLLPNNLKQNLISNNNPNKNLAVQSETDANSLIGGSANQIAASQIDGEPIFAASIDSGFYNQLEIIREELQSLKNKLTKLNSADKLNLSGGELTGELEIQDNLTLNSTAKTESIIPQSDDKYDLGSSDKGFDSAYIHQLWGSSILTIGDGETSHSLADTDDLLISGKLEVNGNSYFDGNTIFGGTINVGGSVMSNLGTPIVATDAATKAYVDAASPIGVFSRIGTTISPTTSGDTIDFADSLLTFDSAQLFGGSTLTQLGLLSTASSDIQVQITGLDTEKEDSLTKGDVIAGNGITLSGNTTDAIIGSNLTISTAQDIRTTASPTFAGLTLGASGLNMSDNLITNIGHTDTNFTAGGGLELEGTLSVGLGASTFLGGVTIGGSLLAPDITTTGSVDVGGGLSVTGNTTITGTLRGSENNLPNYNFLPTGLDNISLRPHPSAENPVISPADIVPDPCVALGGTGVEFVADPFLFPAESTSNYHKMFFEIKCAGPAVPNKVAGLATSDDAIKWKYWGVVAETGGSYPIVVKENGNYYMMPETGATDPLYRATTWPTVWEEVTASLPHSGDTTYFHDGTYWWAIGGDTGNCSVSPEATMCDVNAYYSTSLEGTWTAHPDNPVVRERQRGARPGGRVLVRDDYKIIFFQDTSSNPRTLTASVHDGEANASALRAVTSDGNFISDGVLVGDFVYNITDGSNCIITARTGFTITCTLKNGEDNDWDVGDVAEVDPAAGEYAHRVRAYKIKTLTPTVYDDVELASSPILEENLAESWRVGGMHQVDIMPTTVGSAIAVVDGRTASSATGYSIGIFEVGPENTGSTKKLVFTKTLANSDGTFNPESFNNVTCGDDTTEMKFTAIGYAAAAGDSFYPTTSVCNLTANTSYYVCPDDDGLGDTDFWLDNDDGCVSVVQYNSTGAVSLIGSGITLPEPTTHATVLITASSSTVFQAGFYRIKPASSGVPATIAEIATDSLWMALTDTCTNMDSSKLCVYDNGNNWVIENATGATITVIIDMTYY